MRGRMNDGKSYLPPFELGKPLEGGAVGEVIESRAKEFKPGDAVTSNFGWREYFMASPKELHPVSRQVQPLSVYLGALGMTGMTAWVGLNSLARDSMTSPTAPPSSGLPNSNGGTYDFPSFMRPRM